jgi:hypothetical protein
MADVQPERGLGHGGHARLELRSKLAERRQIAQLAKCRAALVHETSLLRLARQVQGDKNHPAAGPLNQSSRPVRKIRRHGRLGGECEYQGAALPGGLVKDRHPELFAQARERLGPERKHRVDGINDEVIVEQRDTGPFRKFARDSQLP